MTELTSGTEEVQKGAINLNVSAGDLTFGDIDDGCIGLCQLL